MEELPNVVVPNWPGMRVLLKPGLAGGCGAPPISVGTELLSKLGGSNVESVIINSVLPSLSPGGIIEYSFSSSYPVENNCF